MTMGNKLVKDIDVVKKLDTLHKKSEYVDKLDSLVSDTLNKLKQYMKINVKCQGISAIQLGVPIRLCVVRLNSELHVMYNPKLSLKVLFQLSNEGCMSIPDKRYYLLRPYIGKVCYEDEEFNKRSMFLNKKNVRIVAHEIDHMNGILICDKGREVFL